MKTTPARPDTAPTLSAFSSAAPNVSPADAAEQSAASSAPSLAGAAVHAQTLLTPAVTRVIAWHQQRLSARHGGASV